jgi:UDPglucose--hexose-1-phosphate uridylyltransferase
MSDVRRDPLTGDWTIIAENRAARPIAYRQRSSISEGWTCPFCAGQESQTPSAISAYSISPSLPWKVRVIPNKFPALVESNGQVPIHDSRIAADYLFAQGDDPSKVNRGLQEIVIESPRHIESFSQLNDDEIMFSMQAYQESVRRHQENRNGYAYTSLFKNCRLEAGASIPHVHSQIMSLGFVPPAVQRRAELAEAFWKKHGVNLLTQQVAMEQQQGCRMVAETDRWVAYCPYASRFPYQVCVAGKSATPTFQCTALSSLVELGNLLRKLLRKLELLFPHAAYNSLLRLAPFDRESDDSQSWCWEVFPRMTKPAGFEWGTDCFINPVSPETAAASLRAAVD